MNVVHFPSGDEFRRWLEKNHATAAELQIGFHYKGSGRTGMSYKEAVDEALCFGWIDGVVRKIDEASFTRRFTPRKASSIWSNVNVGHVARLTEAGKMRPAGLRAFAARKTGKVGIYSFEQKKPQPLSSAYLRKFKADRKAWAFFCEQAPWYQRKIIHNVLAGKQAATRLRRLNRVIAASSDGVII